jgi:outer membrane protein assembly factor BamB
MCHRDPVRAVLIPLLSAALLVIVVSSCKKNHPPDVPAVPTGPSVCFKDTTCTFTTTATDPDGDNVAVRLTWSEDSASKWSAWFASGDTVALTHVWINTGTFEIRAQTMDSRSHVSVWSRPLTVQVLLRRPPDTPHAPIGPDKGGQDSSYTFAAAANHPDSIAVAIRFAWGDGDTSGWSPYVTFGESVKMSHAWTAPDTYLITAQARDTGNALSEWSLKHAVNIWPPDTMSKWRFQLATGEDIYLSSSPAIGPDGTIYVGSFDSSLYAVNPDGALKWRYLTGSGVQSSPAIAADGTVYFGSDDKRLYSLNPDGTFRWRYFLGSSVTSCPAIAADGTIYVGSYGYLYAFNTDSTLKWFYVTGGIVRSSPTITADGTVYVGSENDYLYALNPDGTLKWRYKTDGSIYQSCPAIATDGTVYCGSDDKYVYALNPDGTRRWRYKTGDHVRSSPAIAADGTVYFGSQDNQLYALNPDGILRWKYKTGGDVRSSPAIAADGTIYVGSTDDCLYALGPDGTFKWRHETDGAVMSSPTIGPDGTVYFTSDDGYLYALKGTSPLADSPWPKIHHDLRNTGRVGGGK